MAASIELLMNLVDATYQARNAGSLAAAVREVNRIRYLVRLAEALRVINLAGHEFAAQAMDEVGRMAGGWLKSTRQRQLKGWEKPHRDCPRGGAGKGVKR